MSWSIESNGKARDVAHEIVQNEHIPDEVKSLVVRCIGDRHGVPELSGMSVKTDGHIDKTGGSLTLEIRWLGLAKAAPDGAFVYVVPIPDLEFRGIIKK